MRFRILMITAVAIGFVCAPALAPSAPADESSERPETNQPETDQPEPVEQPESERPAEEPVADEQRGDALPTRQDALAHRYKQFEKTLLQMAEYMRKTDPDRADLLIRAISRSKEERVAQQMEQVVALLESDRFGDAIDQQDDLVVSLRGLLDLLQSENRLGDIEAEKERIQDLLRDLGRLLGRQVDTRVQTDRGEDPERLADRQQNVADDTQKLGDKIDRQDAERSGRDGEERDGEGRDGEAQEGDGQAGDSEEGEGRDGDSESGESQPGDGEPGDGEAGDGEPGDGEPGDSEPGDGESGDGESGDGESGDSESGDGESGDSESGDSQSGEGEPGDGEPGDSQPGDSSDADRTPGREEIEQAHREMERAIEELKKQNRDEASGSQDEAIAKLREAKEKLEEILRQLREEERELLLAALEARFQKMLAMQLAVYHGTVSLDKTPKQEWTSRHFGRARELAGQQDEIVLEATKALTLLQGEGSSVAFPEAIEQLHEDMQLVARQLEQEEVGELTQAIERDIIEALEELIEALQRELEKSRDDQQSDEAEGEPSDLALVDQLAELKMLRSLQMRVNRRTQQLGRLIDDGEQAQEAEVVDQLRGLSRRQSRIQEATYDLATGRNR